MLEIQPKLLSTAPALGRGNILLVDDDPWILQAYGRFLDSQGYSVTRAEDGETAEALLRTERFDVVVSDINLGRFNGIQILQVARTRDPDLPVILITGGGDLPSAVRAIELGAIRYLQKPVDLVELGARVEEALTLRQTLDIERLALMRFVHQHPDLDMERRKQSGDLDRALTTLHLAYQPIVRFGDRTVFAYEALARTHDAVVRGPSDLFSLAERLGRLVEVDRQIHRKIGDALRPTQGDPLTFVNVHPLSLADDRLFEGDSPLAKIADHVVLEVTEQISVQGTVNARAKLERLRELGFRIALDDLGAGYSGLSSFALVEPDIVKIDMSLTRDIHRSATKQKLVGRIVQLCHELDRQLIAEGVETTSELQTLLGLGCDLYQGYLFAKPGPPFVSPVWPSEFSGHHQSDDEPQRANE